MPVDIIRLFLFGTDCLWAGQKAWLQSDQKSYKERRESAGLKLRKF